MTDIIDRAKDVEMRQRQHALANCLERAKEPAQHIENGQVLCIDCGTEVSAARLAAKPNAARCLVCQERAEKESPIG